MEFAQLIPQESAVPFGSSLDAKEQVKQAIDIVDLVGSYLQLRRQGRGYVAHCPWHDDSRPSLQVNPERQSFKCWVCDIGGDVFSFIMKMEGVEFREALAMLADRAGIALAPSKPEPKPGGAPNVHDKRTLLKAMAWAERQYHACLLEASDAEPARRYLAERGITPESIEKFHVGFAPLDRDWILKQAGGNPGRARVLEAVGILLRPSEGGSLFDRFRGRVLFSIRDAQGRPVGVGGRLLPELGMSSPAKYVNSPETPLFSKSHLLYGLDVAREAMRRSRVALVMEGYTDCIVAHQYGFDNAVAVLGTALGERHVHILKRFADRIILVLDGDEAGQKRTNEVLELFVAQQVDLDILTLPEDLDPCDFLHQRGADAFRDLIEHHAVDALEHAYRTATRNIDLERDVHGASQALERLITIVAKAPRLQSGTTTDDRLREGKILQRFAAMFRVDEIEIRRRLTDLRRRGQSKPSPVRSAQTVENETKWKPGDRLDPFARELLEFLMCHPEFWTSVTGRVRPDQFGDAVCQRLFSECVRLSNDGSAPTFERLMLEFDEPSMKSLLVELDAEGQAKGNRMSDLPALLEKLIQAFERKEVEQRRPADIVALREGRLDSSQATQLLEDIFRQERNRQGISEPTDG